jgi:Pentapeptide repeats (8 copies)
MEEQTKQQQTWWQRINQHRNLSLVIIVASALVLALIVVVVLGYLLNWPWVGVSGGNSTITTTTTATGQLPAKTLWDWLQLLFVPAILTLGAVLITARQNHDREISEKQQKADRELAIDNQQEAAWQAYIDNMSELILEKKLRESQPRDEVRKIARVRTLAVLRRLNAERKRIVLQFLHDSDLIDKDNTIIGLHGANLRGADLHGVYQPKANLHEAQLNGANLRGANLREADLSKANMSGADLSGADLTFADLRGAHLRETILKKARYNTKPIPKKDEKEQPVIDQQGKPVLIEPTQWPQGFDLKKPVGLICVDC